MPNLIRKWAATLALLMLAAGPSLAQDAPSPPADVAGWERTLWGMSPLELDSLIGRAMRIEPGPNGVNRYSVDRYEFGGVTFQVEFILTQGRGLSVVHMGGGFADVSREREASVVERSMRAAFGNNPIVRTEVDINRTGVRELEKEMEWRFPSTRIVVHRYFRSSPDGEINDLLTVTFLATR